MDFDEVRKALKIWAATDPRSCACATHDPAIRHAHICEREKAWRLYVKTREEFLNKERLKLLQSFTGNAH